MVGRIKLIDSTREEKQATTVQLRLPPGLLLIAGDQLS